MNWRFLLSSKSECTDSFSPPSFEQKERNWFIVQLQNLAKIKRCRVTFVSGDVHVAAVGVLKSLKAKNKPEVLPALDYRYMVNIVTSA